MHLLTFILSKSKVTILAAITFGLVSGACSTMLITTIHRATDPGTAADPNLPVIFLGLAIAFLVTSLVGQVPLFYLAEGAIFNLRVEMIRRILASRLRFLEEIGGHRLFATLTSDINQIANGMVQIPRIGIYGMICLGCFGYMAYLSWQVLVAMVVFIVVMVLVYKSTMRLATARFTSSRETGDILFKHFKAVTEGTKELKAHAKRREAFLNELLVPTADAYRRDRIRGLVNFQVSSSVGNLGFFLVIGFIIFLLPTWHDMNDTVTSGIVLVFVFLIGPLGALFDIMPSISQASVALRKVTKLGLDLDANIIEQGKDERGASEEPFRELSLEGVRHTYYNERADEQFSLGPISLRLKAGEVVFLVGGNGSGKSTLAKLIAGFYEPEEGLISLNAEMIDDQNRERLRNCFSTVFTDFFLFEAFLGIEDKGLVERANTYLRELHLDHKVRIENGGLSTTDLSTGQRKRLALLVTYLEDRPIYLFDEWASDQDPQFKKVFYTEILPDLSARGKSVLAVTHDDAYFDQADRIIKLADGHISEEQGD